MQPVFSRFLGQIVPWPWYPCKTGCRLWTLTHAITNSCLCAHPTDLRTAAVDLCACVKEVYVGLYVQVWQTVCICWGCVWGVGERNDYFTLTALGLLRWKRVA